MRPYGAGFHVMSLDLGLEGPRDWTYAAERGLVLGCEYMLIAEAKMDDIDSESSDR